MSCPASSLLHVPDPCLVVVLQFCADDLQSLFRAARSHSRLHQAAVLALSSISVESAAQEQVDGLLLYLQTHGQHVESMDLTGVRSGLVSVHQLPPFLQLDSLKLYALHLQLQPGAGFQGLVRSGVPLKQLRLRACKLLDGMQGLAAALALLPDLQHLSISAPSVESREVSFPVGVLSGMQQLTYLELAYVVVQGPNQGAPALQPLQALTQLADLRLAPTHVTWEPAIDGSVVSAMRHLTRLEVTYCAMLAAGAMEALTQLQHLTINSIEKSMMSGGAARLVSRLQALQQLTYLRMQCIVREEGDPPAAVFSALTASSKLQHLDISYCVLPTDVWQHVFCAGRQLPHLWSLNITHVSNLQGDLAAPEGPRLVSCCPGLQSVAIQGLQSSAELLASLGRLSGLHTLRLTADAEEFQAVCQLTTLRELHMYAPELLRDRVRALAPARGLGLFLQLTHLKQLTCLGFAERSGEFRTLTSKTPGDEPVWRQVLRLLTQDSNPEVAQQAVETLADVLSLE